MADLLGEPPDKNRAKEDRGTRLPADWEPSSVDMAFAGDWGVDYRRILADFKDYWAAKPGAAGRKVDWPATWRTWVRKVGRPPMDTTKGSKLDLLAQRPKGGRTLAAIHKTYGEAWHAITEDVLKELADDIDVAAAGLQEGDRAHFRGLVAEEVRTLCSPLAQAIAAGRERPPFPHGRIDLVALARRTESQLHSTAGYEGRKNLSWWERRYGATVARLGTRAEPPDERPPAPEMVWDNPNTLGGDRDCNPTSPVGGRQGSLPHRVSPPGTGWSNPNK